MLSQYIQQKIIAKESVELKDAVTKIVNFDDPITLGIWGENSLKETADAVKAAGFKVLYIPPNIVSSLNTHSKNGIIEMDAIEIIKKQSASDKTPLVLIFSEMHLASLAAQSLFRAILKQQIETENKIVPIYTSIDFEEQVETLPHSILDKSFHYLTN